MHVAFEVATVMRPGSDLDERHRQLLSHADEAEALLGKRRDNEHEVSIQIKTEFMQLWDGLTTDHHAGVLVLAATNRPGELDEAVLRRFSHQYEVQTLTSYVER